MVLFTSRRKYPNPHLGRRWGREQRRIGAGVRVLYRKRERKEGGKWKF